MGTPDVAPAPWDADLWLIRAERPSTLAVCVLGAMLVACVASLYHGLWLVPLAAAMSACALGRGLLAWLGEAPRVAGPEIDWLDAWRGIAAPDARALLERVQALESRAAQLAHGVEPQARDAAAEALGRCRDLARAGISVAVGIDRLDALLRVAAPERARTDVEQLRERAALRRDPVAAATLLSAARRRARHVQDADEFDVLRERLRADGEDLVAELEHAALGAEWAAVRAVVCDRPRVHVAVAREVLAELRAGDDGAARAHAEPPSALGLR